MSIAPAPEASEIGDLHLSVMRVEPLGDDVHLWVLEQPDHTSSQSGDDEHWRALLSPDEVQRAQRFRFAHHGAAFVASRARLRLLLSAYLGCEPASLKFTYSETGKPEVSKDYGDIFFNLSHTEGLALIALSKRGRVGVDIEKMDAAHDSVELARNYFSEAEILEIGALASIEQQAAFYRCWTRKEAYLKALGDGLSRPLSDFTVSIGLRNAELLECKWDPGATASWQLFSLNVDTRYAAALAYEGNHFRLPYLPKTYHWSRSL